MYTDLLLLVEGWLSGKTGGAKMGTFLLLLFFCGGEARYFVDINISGGTEHKNGDCLG